MGGRAGERKGEGVEVGEDKVAGRRSSSSPTFNPRRRNPPFLRISLQFSHLLRRVVGRSPRILSLSLSLARHNEHGRHGVVVGARQLPHAFGHSQQQQQQFFQCRFLGHPCGRRNTNARSVHKLQPRSFGEHQGGHGHGRGRGRHGREDCAAVARNLPVQGGARNAGGVQVPQLLPGLSQQNPQNPSSIVTNLECFGTR